MNHCGVWAQAIQRFVDPVQHESVSSPGSSCTDHGSLKLWNCTVTVFLSLYASQNQKYYHWQGLKPNPIIGLLLSTFTRVLVRVQTHFLPWSNFGVCLSVLLRCWKLMSKITPFLCFPDQTRKIEICDHIVEDISPFRALKERGHAKGVEISKRSWVLLHSPDTTITHPIPK